MADPRKMSMTEFAQRIKSGHPEYAQLDDQELANRVLAKFPQYRQHVDMVAPAPKQPSTYDQLTAPGSSAGAMEFDAKHPIAGKFLRAFDAAGGAVLGLPGSVYHAFADPTTDGRSKWEAVPERLLGGEATAQALQDYGSGKVTPQGALSVLPEALGTGAGTVAGTGLAMKGLGGVTRPGLAKAARLGARVSDFDLTKPLSLAKPALEHVADRLENKAPTERDATLVKSNIPEYAGEEEPSPLGSPENPGIHSKIPLRTPKSVLAEETPTGSTQLSQYGSPRRGRMGPPLRPNVFSSEEAAQIYDNQMARLGAEAKDAGMYSAARGAVRRIPDYQERIGRTLNPYGGEPTEPVDLQESEQSPKLKKSSGQ